MRRFFQAAAVCCVITAAAVFCVFIFSSGEADWLRVETPSIAFPGESFPVRITLLQPVSGLYLGADLHWMDKNKVSRGYFSGCVPVKTADGKSVYQLSIPVRPERQTAFVFCVIILSAEGTWSTRIKAADLEPVPVIDKAVNGAVPETGFRTAHVISNGNHVLPAESVPLRFVTAAIWFVISFFFIIGKHCFQSGRIASAALVSSVWEALNGSAVIGNLSRGIALSSDMYDDRTGLQTAMTLAVAAVLLVILLRYIMKDRHPLNLNVWLCVAVFWGVSFIRLFSLHGADALLTKTMAGFEAGQLSRFFISLACLTAVLVSFFKARFRNRTG